MDASLHEAGNGVNRDRSTARGTALASAELRGQLLRTAEELRERIATAALDTQEALRLQGLLTDHLAEVDSGSYREGYLSPDGSLRLVDWADRLGEAQEALRVHAGERGHTMQGHLATGESLVSNGRLGADIIRCAAGGGFAPHTHIGDHLLFAVAGEGTIAYDGRIYPTFPGQVYFVEGAVPHAVGAITDHVLISVGVPHRAVDAADRQTLQEYASILADFTSLRCELCGIEAKLPKRLADLGCPHCPSRFL